MMKPGTFARVLRLAMASAVCLAPLAVSSPAQQEGAAVLALREGRVDVLRDNVPWALREGDSVQPGQIVVTGPDGYAQFQLSEGSIFEVFPDSRVTFRANQGDWRDLVDVWLGRIRVHIQKLGGRPNPNRISTPTAVISVRGTVFHVGVEDSGTTTFVLVEEGLVDVRHRLMPGRPVPLGAGESLRVFETQPLAARNIDRGAVADSATRALAQAVAEILWRRRIGGPGASGGSVPGAGGGPVGVGDERAPDAPPPPPPPPPPPQ